MARSTKKRTGRVNGNPGNGGAESYQGAAAMSEKWHGRAPREIEEIEEIETYDVNLGKLADLLELNILNLDGKRVTPIGFKDCGVSLAGKDNQLFFIGGDQQLSLDDLKDLVLGNQEIDGSKQYIDIGDVYSIAYFADKHHLMGSKAQAKGVDYEHVFGEQTEDGQLPGLVYDARNQKLLLVGGSYEIRAEGIWN